MIIAVPFSTENQRNGHDPQMHQAKKGKQWHIDLKAHIGMDAKTGVMHALMTTPANAVDVTQAYAPFAGEGENVFGDAGLKGSRSRKRT